MNRRRKLLLFGAVNKARQLADAFFASVIADGGEIESEQVFVDFFQLILDHNALSFMQEHSKVLFPEARRLTATTTNVNKWYNLFPKYGDATQTEASRQPFAVDGDRNGKAVLDYDFERFLSMPNALSFSRNVGFISSKVVHQDGQNRFSGLVEDRINAGARYIFAKPDDINGIAIGGRRLDTDSFQQITTSAIDNWQMQDGVIDLKNGIAKIVRDKELVVSTTSFQTAGNTSDTDVEFVTLGALAPLSASSFQNSKVGAHIRFNAPPSAALSEAIDDFLMDYYNLPA